MRWHKTGVSGKPLYTRKDGVQPRPTLLPFLLSAKQFSFHSPIFSPLPNFPASASPMALRKLAFRLGSNTRPSFAKCRHLLSLMPPTTTLSGRHASQAVNSNGKRAFFFDTLAMVNYLYLIS